MIRFMSQLFKRLVTTALAIMMLYTVIIVNIGLTALRQFKSNRIFDTHIQITEDSARRQIAEHERLYVKLDALIGLAVLEDGRTVFTGTQIEDTEVHICRQVHTRLVGVATIDLVRRKAPQTATYLRMHQDIEIPFEGQCTAADGSAGLELMVRHIVEIIVIGLVLAVSRILGTGRGRTIEIDGELRTYHEIEPIPFSSDQEGDIHVHHMAQVARLIHQHVHIECIALRIHHADGHVEVVHLIGIKLVHRLRATREEEIIMIQPVIDTDIGIHTGRRLASGYIMQ